MNELEKIKELTTPPNNDYSSHVWSDECADYSSLYHNKELNTCSFLFVGCWVKK